MSWKPKVLVLGKVSKAICFLPGPAFHWWWYRQSRWQCVLSSSVSFWSLDGKQATVLCTWELLEGNTFLFRIYTFLPNNEHFFNFFFFYLFLITEFLGIKFYLKVKMCRNNAYWWCFFNIYVELLPLYIYTSYRSSRCGIRNFMFESNRMLMSSLPVL